MRIGVVIVHWSDWSQTRSCLRSVKESGYSNLLIEVIDNDSDNLGFAGGANVGIRRLLADPGVEFIVVLNNDVRVSSGFFDAIARTIRMTGADMIAPAVFRDDDQQDVDRYGIVMSKSLLGFDMKQIADPLFCPSGCAAGYSRQLLEDVVQDDEYFDEDFFMYAEDTDLGFRARLLGYTCELSVEAIAYHLGGKNEEMAAFLGHRNTAWYIAKNAPFHMLLFLFVPILIAQLASVVVVSFQGKPFLILNSKFQALKGLPTMLRKRRSVQQRRTSGYGSIRAFLWPSLFYFPSKTSKS